MKLTKEQILAIPEELKTKTRTDLAKEWKISRSVINYWITEFKKKKVEIPKLSRGLLNEHYKNENTKITTEAGQETAS